MFRVCNDAGRATVYLYGTIGPDFWDEEASNTAKEFSQTLDKLTPKPLDIRIDSGGGDVYEAFGIASAIQRYGGETVAHVDGLAASAASYIAEVCDRVVMSDFAQLMVHKAWTFAGGNADDLLAIAARLESIDANIAGIISKRSGMPVDEVMAAMAAETWFSAADALEHGLCDEVIETEERIAACIDARIASRYSHVPASVTVSDEDAAGSESHAEPMIEEARTEGRTVLLGNHIYRLEGVGK